jgi:predicted nucleic acid-binding protein
MVSLIDTDVMIDVSRGNAGAAGYLDSLSDPAISIVTAQELIVGARDNRDLTITVLIVDSQGESQGDFCEIHAHSARGATR